MGEPFALDILAVGAHPDDVELGMGATIAMHSAMGYRTGVLDLTAAELSTGGTVAERQQEAEQSARILGVALRVNLGFADRGFARDSGVVPALVTAIRRYRPRVVAAPHREDRHPDHSHCFDLVKEAVFTSGLVRWEDGLEPWRPQTVLYYFVDRPGTRPDFICDVSRYYRRKRESLAVYRSQFRQDSGQPPTPLNDPRFLRGIEARDRYFGSLISADYGEGFVVPFVLRVNDLTCL